MLKLKLVKYAARREAVRNRGPVENILIDKFKFNVSTIFRIVIIVSVMSACTPAMSTIETPTKAITSTPTFPHNPTPTATQDPNKSKYFDKVELLESKNIQLKPGDDLYLICTSAIYDMDADGTSDAIFTISTYPKNTSHPIVIINGDGPVNNIAEQVFPDGVLSVFISNQIIIIDLNNDDREDIVISDAGLDRHPFLNPEAMNGIALNRGDGIFEDVSANVPDEAKGLRNYSIAAGDLYNDGIVRIVLPSQAITAEDEEPPNHIGPEKSGLLFWDGNTFRFQQNWIDKSLWYWPGKLYSSSFMAVEDIDGDGWQDLYLSGTWMTPNHRVLYGHEDFPSEQYLEELPEGPFGHTSWDYFMLPDVDMTNGSDVNKVVLEDFDQDGDLDIVSIMEDVQWYKPGAFEDETHDDFDFISEEGGVVYGNVWFQVLRNEGDRNFIDVESQGRNLGARYYISILTTDIDLDGDTDLIGQYWNKVDDDECINIWGSTIFINQGDLVFHTVDAADIFPELSAQANEYPANSWVSDCATSGLGVLFPTVITPEGMKGLFVVPIQDGSERPKLRVLRFNATGRFHIPD